MRAQVERPPISESEPRAKSDGEATGGLEEANEKRVRGGGWGVNSMRITGRVSMVSKRIDTDQITFGGVAPQHTE